VLGTLVSGGVIGTAALLVLVVVVLSRVLRSGRADGVAGIAAYVVAGAAFPLWESNPAALVAVGLVVVATRTPRTAPHAGLVVGPGTGEAARPVRPALVGGRTVRAGVR
jgi:hypothetical protein